MWQLYVTVNAVQGEVSACNQVFMHGHTNGLKVQAELGDVSTVNLSVQGVEVVPIVRDTMEGLQPRRLAGAVFQNERDWTQHTGGIAVLRVQSLDVDARLHEEKEVLVNVGRAEVRDHANQLAVPRVCLVACGWFVWHVIGLCGM